MLKTCVETLKNGKRLRVARLGEGEPVILLHGYPENLQIWSRLAPLLAIDRRVIAFDWPGMGYNDPWTGGATPFHQAERLLTLLDEWRIDRASILGTDMGGQPALVFAAKHPDRINNLIAMNCLAFPNEDTSWEIQLLRRYGWNRMILRYFPRIVFKRAEFTFLKSVGRLSEELRRDLWNAFRRPETREFIIRLCGGYQGTLPQLPALYSTIGCRTLVLWAENDGHFPLAHAYGLQKEISGAALRVIPKGGHWMAWQNPDSVADALKSFLGPPHG